MNIGYILGMFPKISETFILNEIVELIRMGHKVHIFSIHRPQKSIVHPEVNEYHLLGKTSYSPSYFKLGVELLKFDSLLFYKNRKKIIINKFYCIAIARYFSKIIKKLNLNVLHAHYAVDTAYTAMLISKLTGIPFTFTGHALDIFVNPDIRALKERMENASAVITISHYNKNYLHNLTKVDKDKIFIVRACPNIERYKTIKRDEDPSTILTVGRLVEKKGIKYGILAIKELVKEYPNIRYNIVGSGPLKNELQDLIRKLALGKKIRLLGNLDYCSLTEKLSKATVFILPCVKAKNGDMDGIPVSLMEAMYLQIPVISTKISGIPELIETGREGILVEPKNIKQLSNAIKSLLEDKNLRIKMGRNGRRKIEAEFNIHKEVSKLVNIWENCRR